MSTARWESPEFRAELTAFVAEAVGEPRELVQERLRPWSTVWRVVTDSGTHFAKENCVGQRHEAALVARLGEIAPDLVVPATAHDPRTGLLLTPDQGTPLGDRGPADVETWTAVVGAAADLQRAVLPHVDELGLTVLAPADATSYVATRVAELSALDAADPRRLPDDVAREVDAALPGIERAAQEVAALGLPLTINHNDLHAHNVFVDAAGGVRFFDLGDAVLSDPLGALRIPLASAEDDLGAASDDPRIARIADEALERWSGLAPMADLRRALPAALRLSCLARVESWYRCLGSMTPSELADYGEAPARWLGLVASGGS